MSARHLCLWAGDASEGPSVSPSLFYMYLVQRALGTGWYFRSQGQPSVLQAALRIPGKGCRSILLFAAAFGSSAGWGRSARPLPFLAVFLISNAGGPKRETPEEEERRDSGGGCNKIRWERAGASRSFSSWIRDGECFSASIPIDGFDLEFELFFFNELCSFT